MKKGKVMSCLESGDVQIFGRVFKVYGFDDDVWYQGVKLNGVYGEFNLSNLAQLIGPSDVCLDIGANVGMMTLAMAMLAPKGHVYAFEGSPQTTLALTETIKANNLDNVSAYSAIIGHSKEKVNSSMPRRAVPLDFAFPWIHRVNCHAKGIWIE